MKTKILKSFKCYDTTCKLVRYTDGTRFFYYVELKTSVKDFSFQHDYTEYSYAAEEFNEMLKSWMY